MQAHSASYPLRYYSELVYIVSGHKQSRKKEVGLDDYSVYMGKGI